MTSHRVERVPGRTNDCDAFDVASRWRWTGRAEQRDVRDSTWISPPELPWPLRFDFVQAEDEDGVKIRVLAGFEIGAPIARDDNRDTDEYELSAARIALIWENFNRYRRMAEELLVPTPTNRAKAARTRATMGRRRGGQLSPDYLLVLLAEWRGRAGEDSRSYSMAAERGIDRSTLHRQIKRAQRIEAESDDGA